MCLVIGLLSKIQRSRVDFAAPSAVLLCLGAVLGKLALSDTSGQQFVGSRTLGSWNVIVAASAGSLMYGVLQHSLPKKLGGTFFEGEWDSSGAVKGAMVGVAAMASGAGYIAPEYAVLSTMCSCTLVFLVDFLTKDVKIAGFDAFVSSSSQEFECRKDKHSHNPTPPSPPLPTHPPAHSRRFRLYRRRAHRTLC